jgi:lysophospholipase L1-like esterase
MDRDPSFSAAAGGSVTIPQTVYVALGDSTGVGMGARKGGGYVDRLFHRLQRAQPSSRLINLCVSGATSSDALREQVDPAALLRPTVVTLCIGINDVTRDVAVTQFGANMRSILLRLKAAGSPQIVLSNLPDVSLAPIVPRMMRAIAHRRVTAYNRCLGELALEHGVTLVDMYQHSREMIPAHPEFFSPDRFHPSDEGYEYWAFVMWPSLKSALRQVSPALSLSTTGEVLSAERMLLHCSQQGAAR